MRSRGKVQRTHIITHTNMNPLKMNTRTLTRLPAVHQSQLSGSANSQGKRPVCQPPRNRMVAMPLTANMLPYSAMKKINQRKPLYSVWNPATSSLSASARSNGARLQLAVPQVKKIQKAANVNGSWNMYQSHIGPACIVPTVLRFMVPATM